MAGKQSNEATDQTPTINAASKEFILFLYLFLFKRSTIKFHCIRVEEEKQTLSS